MKTQLIASKERKDARLMLLRQFLSIPLGFAKALIIIPIILPELMFVLKIISTWLGYLPRVALGTFAVLGFYYPAAIAEGKVVLADQYRFLAWRFALFGVLAGALAGFAISYYLAGEYLIVLVFWGMVIVPNSYTRSIFQAEGNFRKIAQIDITLAIVGFVLPLTGLLLWGFKGYLVCLAITLYITLILGRSSFFPKKIKLTLKFIKESLYRGGNLWVNGILADLVKSFDITLFAFISVVSANFGGQYAVAMTLQAIADKLVTSVSIVYQRQVVMKVSKAKESNMSDNSIIFDFVILDLLLFVVIATGLLMGSYALVYFAPEYGKVIYIFPFLLLGGALLRFRFYPGVIFKTDNKFNILHVAHIINIIFGCGGLLLFVFMLESNAYHWIAFSKIIGACMGSVLSWYVFMNKNKGKRYTIFYLKVFLLLVILVLWIFGYVFTLSHIFLNLTILLGGGVGILLLVKLLFSHAFELFMNLFISFKKVKV